MRPQEVINERNCPFKSFLGIVHQIKVIHITAVVPESQFTFAELVKFIEVDIRKELGCEIAYGKTATLWSVEKALGIGKSFLVRKGALDAAPFRWVQKHHLVQKKQDNVNVKTIRQTAFAQEAVQTTHYQAI